MGGDVYSQAAASAGDLLRFPLILATFAIGFSLGGLLALLIAPVLRKRSGAAPEVIYKAIREDLDEALKTPGPNSIAKARALQRTINQYLGPVRALNADTTKMFADLEAAIEGKVKPPTPPAGHPSARGAGPAAAAASAAAGGAAAAVASIGQTEVAILATPAAAERAATTKEQVRMVRDALEALNEYWASKTVVGRLDAAQQALQKPPPLPPKPPAAHH